MFAPDLGMGYRNYDNLVFDLFQNSLTSLTCKVYIGNPTNNKPVKIICGNFLPSTITTTTTIQFGFWVQNPAVTIALAVPVQVYFEEVYSYTFQKVMWQML